jgi:hypothetical protein
MLRVKLRARCAHGGNGEVIITWVPARDDDPEAPATMTSADLLMALSPSPATAMCWRRSDQAV